MAAQESHNHGADVTSAVPQASMCPDDAEPSISKNPWNWLLPLIVFGVAFILQRAVALRGLDLHHDTLMFDAARQALNGEIPFKDFFYQYNLGTLFLHVLALKVLGAQIVSLKVATALAYALIALLIYACAAIHGRRWCGLVAALLWSTLSPFHMPAVNGYHPWSTVYMMGSIMGGALCLSLALKGRPFWWAVLAGVCFNFAFWFKQVAGLQILVVLAWIIVAAWLCVAERSKFKAMLSGYAIGGLLSALPFFFYMRGHLLYLDWWQSAVVFNGLFAASGHSTTGAIAFVRTLFPVSRDIGYLSVIWAVLPLSLLAGLLLWNAEYKARSFAGSDALGVSASLFAALGIAGWVEYFPLAHAFHTQLFMAPVFVLLALSYDIVSKRGIFLFKQPASLFLIFSLFVATYEAGKHLSGWIAKVGRPVVLLKDNGPASGLVLTPENARSFGIFYQAFVAAKESHIGMPSIPMSVDPLRALLPDRHRDPSEFKMGLDWTWPNEIVEPDFNKRLVQKIAERKAVIYADSLIGISGYIPVALLEMQSPLTAIHTLYLPSADRVVTDPQTIVQHDLFGLNISALDASVRKSFLRLGNLEGVSMDDIDQLHVSYVQPDDLPSTLSKLQYERFLTAIPAKTAARAAALYERDGRSDSDAYSLRKKRDPEVMLELAKFMLSRGKLFERQNRPLFFSTLASSRVDRPFLAVMKSEGYSAEIAWAKSMPRSRNTSANPRTTEAEYFLVIPADVIEEKEPAILYIQIVHRSRTTRNFYLHYLPR